MRDFLRTLAVGLLLPVPLLAQSVLPRQPGAAPNPFADLARPAPAAPTAAIVPLAIALEAGTGRLLNLPRPALTVLASDPRVARIQPASPTSLFLMAVAAGRTTVVATSDDGTPVAEYDVTVSPSRAAAAGIPAPITMPVTGAAPPAPPPPSAAAVESTIRRMVRGADGVRVEAAGRNGYVLSGMVPGAAEAQRAEAIARATLGEGPTLLNSLSLLSSLQVNLRVRVAEISRQVSRDLGFNWQALANGGNNFLLGLRTGVAGGVAGAITGPLSASTSVARVGAGVSSSRFDINAVVDALASDQLITILAEPNLTAQSGEVASFLAGGEFPIPVAANNNGGNGSTVTIEFKQFGVSLAFVPTVMGPDRLNLRVRPEVSELSNEGAISLPLSGGVVTIPALRVRRAETSVELGSGQSFAIAGLLQRSSSVANTGLSGLGDVPVLGALFRSDRFQRNESELVIIVTPYLVQPVSDPRALAAPTDRVRPASDLARVLERRQISRGERPEPLRARFDAGFLVE